MNTIGKTKDGTQIYYKDWGGRPPCRIFSHGWPLSADAWDSIKCSSWAHSPPV